MTINLRNVLLYGFAAVLIIAAGMIHSWSVALYIFNFGLLSAIMALGVNTQWGYAGLFSVGTMGFIALGGVAAVITAMPPVQEAIEAGAARMLAALAIGALAIGAAVLVNRRMKPGRARALTLTGVLVAGFFLFRYLYDPAVEAIEAVNPAGTGYLGGMGLPVLLSWPIGGLLAAAAAWAIGKASLGLRSDYLAIATLGIAEIIIAVIKNEDWLTRGVKNVSGIPRPFTVPYEVDLQKESWFLSLADTIGADPVSFSSIYVKLSYSLLFVIVLVLLMWLSQRALNSPWGRMMRAIRDNEVAAEAMGKDVTARHLQVFVLGSAILGIAGAMMTTLDGQLTPGTYQPLRFTFLIWVMVIVGGSGNNWGAVLGGFLMMFFWVEAEPIGLWLMDLMTRGMAEDNALRQHLLDSAAHMRLITLGLILLFVLRFSPRGLIPEK